jgi:hypothetical protein
LITLLLVMQAWVRKGNLATVKNIDWVVHSPLNAHARATRLTRVLKKLHLHLPMILRQFRAWAWWLGSMFVPLSVYREERKGVWVCSRHGGSALLIICVCTKGSLPIHSQLCLLSLEAKGTNSASTRFGRKGEHLKKQGINLLSRVANKEEWWRKGSLGIFGHKNLGYLCRMGLARVNQHPTLALVTFTFFSQAS